jgi:hypothetical protein
MFNDQLVLDSCTGNAMAHYVHNVLFWCGQSDVLSWGEVQSLETELYRAHDIESFDTCFARARCGDNIEVLFGATHAGQGASWHREWLECEHATIGYETQGGTYSVTWRDGRVESGIVEKGVLGLLVDNLRHYARYLHGDEARPLTRLQDSRPFVHFNNLLFVAAQTIHSVDAAHVERSPDKEGELVAIKEIEAALEEFGRGGKMPGELGLSWGRAGGAATAPEVLRLVDVVRQMQKNLA